MSKQPPHLTPDHDCYLSSNITQLTFQIDQATHDRLLTSIDPETHLPIPTIRSSLKHYSLLYTYWIIGGYLGTRFLLSLDNTDLGGSQNSVVEGETSLLDKEDGAGLLVGLGGLEDSLMHVGVKDLADRLELLHAVLAQSLLEDVLGHLDAVVEVHDLLVVLSVVSDLLGDNAQSSVKVVDGVEQVLGELGQRKVVGLLDFPLGGLLQMSEVRDGSLVVLLELRALLVLLLELGQQSLVLLGGGGGLAGLGRGLGSGLGGVGGGAGRLGSGLGVLGLGLRSLVGVESGSEVEGGHGGHGGGSHGGSDGGSDGGGSLDSGNSRDHCFVCGLDGVWWCTW